MTPYSASGLRVVRMLKLLDEAILSSPLCIKMLESSS